MLASWYIQQGRAGDVLRVGNLPDPEPLPGEVRVRVSVSGVDPGDAQKRNGWSPMDFPRIIPHSDGAGVIDAVGIGVPPDRIGERVWVYGAQTSRPYGTAAQFTCVPQNQAIPLPAQVGDEIGASLGSPGITAHRAVFGDGPVAGQRVLVHGVLDTVGSLAAQLAVWGGATVIATVSRTTDIEKAQARFPDCRAIVALDSAEAAADVLRTAPAGVERIVDGSLSHNVDFDASVAADHAVITAYGSTAYRPDFPFWQLAAANVTLRLINSTSIPAAAKKQAAKVLTEAAATARLDVPIAGRYPLTKIVCSHQCVDEGVRGRVLVTIPPVG
ncbi:MAG: NADPH:quinone reductase [Mycobacterium sp.]|nr:NADPH:quinone reductase [Mycobacterium sp.]